jgi:hypothetical protein
VNGCNPVAIRLGDGSFGPFPDIRGNDAAELSLRRRICVLAAALANTSSIPAPWPDFALKGDHLETQITGQPAFQVYASAKDRFFLKIVDAQLDFERDAGGKVVALVLHQNGRDNRAPRMTTGR